MGCQQKKMHALADSIENYNRKQQQRSEADVAQHSVVQTPTQAPAIVNQDSSSSSVPGLRAPLRRQASGGIPTSANANNSQPSIRRINQESAHQSMSQSMLPPARKVSPTPVPSQPLANEEHDIIAAQAVDDQEPELVLPTRGKYPSDGLDPQAVVPAKIEQEEGTPNHSSKSRGTTPLQAYPSLTVPARGDSMLNPISAYGEVQDPTKLYRSPNPSDLTSNGRAMAPLEHPRG